MKKKKNIVTNDSHLSSYRFTKQIDRKQISQKALIYEWFMAVRFSWFDPLESSSSVNGFVLVLWCSVSPERGRLGLKRSSRRRAGRLETTALEPLWPTARCCRWRRTKNLPEASRLLQMIIWSLDNLNCLNCLLRCYSWRSLTQEFGMLEEMMCEHPAFAKRHTHTHPKHYMWHRN